MGIGVSHSFQRKFDALDAVDAAHTAAATGIHGVGSDYLAKVKGSQQYAGKGDGTLSPMNMIANPDFELSDPPDGWVDTRATSSRSSAITPKLGSYVMKVLCNDAGGAGASYNTYTISDYTRFKGRYVTFCVWAYCPSANDKTQQIWVSDGVGNTASSTLSKDDTMHFITVTHLVDASATGLYCHFYAKTESAADTNDIIYADLVGLYEGDTPFSYSDFPISQSQVEDCAFFATGTYTGDGASGGQVKTLGFTPQYIKVVAVATGYEAEAFGATIGIHHAAGGGHIALNTDAHPHITTNGFHTNNTDETIYNVNTATYAYIAMRLIEF